MRLAPTSFVSSEMGDSETSMPPLLSLNFLDTRRKQGMLCALTISCASL